MFEPLFFSFMENKKDLDYMILKTPYISKLSQIILLSENAASLRDVHDFLIWGYAHDINPANL